VKAAVPVGILMWSLAKFAVCVGIVDVVELVRGFGGMTFVGSSSIECWDFISGEGVEVRKGRNGGLGETDLSRFSLTECVGDLWFSGGTFGEGGFSEAFGVVVVFPAEENDEESLDFRRIGDRDRDGDGVLLRFSATLTEFAFTVDEVILLIFYFNNFTHTHKHKQGNL